MRSEVRNVLAMLQRSPFAPSPSALAVEDPRAPRGRVSTRLHLHINIVILQNDGEGLDRFYRRRRQSFTGPKIETGTVQRACNRLPIDVSLR